MNNNDNKKSAGLWVHRLYERSGTSLKATQGKTYFAHRYHDNHTILGEIPFSAFFSDVRQQPSKKSNIADFNNVFSHEKAISKANQDNFGSSPRDNPNNLAAPDEGLHIANRTALSTQFKVLNCYDETLDTKNFRLGSLDGELFDYLPGQYITLSVMIAGQEYKRSYSLASSPSHLGIIEITVKRSPNGGVVSNWLHDHLKVGDTVNVKGPYGNFTCAKDTPPKLLLLAAGSGIVPIMSILRWLTDTEANVDVILLLSFQSRYDIIYGEELNLIAARHLNIKLFVTLTKEPPDYSQWRGLTGRVNEKMISNCVPDLAERAVYLCGPDAYMTDCKSYFQELKLPKEQLFCESFTVNSPQTQEQALTQQSTISRPTRDKTGNYRIRFAKSGKSVTADGDLSILELAEQSGIMIGHECRAGDCGECMVKCLGGSVDMTEQAEIDESDRKKGWVYACCAYPASNVVLDI